MSSRTPAHRLVLCAKLFALLALAAAGCQTTTFDSLMVKNSAIVGDSLSVTNNASVGALTVTSNATVGGTVFASAFSSNSPLSLQTAGATRIFVSDMTGYVGINTTTPGSPLDVHGGITTFSNFGGNETSLTIQTVAGTGSLSYAVFDGTTSTSTQKMSIDANTIRVFGRTGFGRDPATNPLEVEGNASKTVASGWAANSDSRIKTGIKTVDGALETLDRVRLVSFDYNDAYRAEHPSLEPHRYLNVVAQEFQQVFPDYVRLSNDKLPNGERILQVDTYPLTIYSAAAVQELHGLVRAQRAEIVRQHDEIESLRSQLSTIQQRLAALETK